MVLKLKTVTLPDLDTRVSGGGAVTSGFVNEVKFSTFEKVEDAAVSLDTKNLVDSGKSYRPFTVISGNVVAVQVQINTPPALTGGSGDTITRRWAACLSADYAAISGAKIGVTAECF